MEFIANRGKDIAIQVDGVTYLRHAIRTHFVGIGEDYLKLIERYALPLYQQGDILCISEKIIALCQRRVVFRDELKVGCLARFLSRFASHSSAGIGVDSPYKMQFAVEHCGRIKVLWAALLAGIGKLLGKKGLFYQIVGQEVSGLDGFYDKEFPIYGNFGIRIPAHPHQVCDEIQQKTGIPCMIVDANDLGVEILGHSSTLPFTDGQLRSLIRDNPAGQSTQMTPLILIRKLPSVA